MSKKNPSKTKIYKKARKEFLKWVEEHSTIYSDYSRWYAGIAKYPDNRKIQHTSIMPNGTPFWEHKFLMTVEIALSLETSLHNLGFLETDNKGGYDKEKSKYVYIFKKYPTVFDPTD